MIVVFNSISQYRVIFECDTSVLLIGIAILEFLIIFTKHYLVIISGIWDAPCFPWKSRDHSICNLLNCWKLIFTCLKEAFTIEGSFLIKLLLPRFFTNLSIQYELCTFGIGILKRMHGCRWSVVVFIFRWFSLNHLLFGPYISIC